MLSDEEYIGKDGIFDFGRYLWDFVEENCNQSELKKGGGAMKEKKKANPMLKAFKGWCEAYGYRLESFESYQMGINVDVARKSDGTRLNGFGLGNSTTAKDWFLAIDSAFAQFDQSWYGGKENVIPPETLKEQIEKLIKTPESYVEYNSDFCHCEIHADIPDVGIFDLRFTGPMVPSQVDKIVKFFESLEA